MDKDKTSDLKRSSSARRSSNLLWTNLRNVIRVKSAITASTKRRRKKKSSAQRVDSFLQKFTIREGENTGYAGDNKDDKVEVESDEDISDDDDDDEDWTFVINPEGDFKFYWLSILCLAIIYNFWTIILRQAWPVIHDNYKGLWFTLDYLCDFLYLIDILMQMRTGYLEQGILVLDDKKLAIKYIKSRYFWLDLVSLTPLDFLYLATSRTHTLIRFPRLLKGYRYIQWSKHAQSRAAHPNILRVGNLWNVILLLMHWLACVYFIICDILGFGTDNWVYPVPDGDYAPVIRQYLASFYWSALTLTMLGDVPEPETEWEYFFQIIAYLMGLFVFATIVGQIGTVIENRNAQRLQFERHVDSAKKYMRAHDVPKDVQERIQRWYDYTWTLDEGDVNSLGLLPDKMRAEVALHVNLKTLKKVTMFNDCPPAFLTDLVLKMRTNVFTPGDLVCRKGEVAREMFIIADGLLEVVGTNGTIVTTLQTGDYFGEIGILNIEGVANRRTADVRSVGYSSLFTLYKDDVLLALQDYPQATEVLALEARRRIKDQVEAVKRKSKASTRVSNAGDTSFSDDDGDASAISPASAMEQSEAENSVLDRRKTPQANGNQPSSDQTRRMSDIVQMMTPRKTNISGPLLKPLNQQRRLVKRKSRPIIGLVGNSTQGKDTTQGKDSTQDKGEEENWATQIANSIEHALKEKMDEYKAENKRLHQHLADFESRIRVLQQDNETKDDNISILWKRVVELEEDIRKARRKENEDEKAKTQGHAEDIVTAETTA
ncbi:cyclic nucleotide-gated channel alpha-3-like [Amphiura filiformis]|uniref:cyclic nucleotide-gated channel alpha-3-like n=1 Tax=Amphiura filiformis TaxID=82378 RepID=UPI003B21AE07